MNGIWGERRHGQTLFEYVLVLVLVSIICVVALTIIGEKTQRPIAEMTNSIP